MWTALGTDQTCWYVVYGHLMGVGKAYTTALLPREQDASGQGLDWHITAT